MEFEERFLYIERDLIRENKFSIAKSELGKIIHDTKINNLSEVLDQARELLRFCNSKEREFSKREIIAKEKLIKEELSKVRNLVFQKKILEGKKLLVNVMQESSSLSESFSSFIFSQASEILDYCEDFMLKKKKLMNIEDMIKEKKYIKAFICLKDLIVEIESYIGDKEKLNREILNRALNLFKENSFQDIKRDIAEKEELIKEVEDLTEKKKYSEAATHLNKLINESESYTRDKKILHNEILNNALISLDKHPNLQISYFEKIVNKLNIRNFIQNIGDFNGFKNFIQERSKLYEEMHSFYIKHKNNEKINKKLVNLFIQFYSSYFEINPFEVDIQYFSISFKNLKENEISRLKGIIQGNEDLENLYYKLTKIDFGSFIDEKLRLISKEVKELKYDVPVENMYYFLLDFSEIMPMSTKTDDSTDNEYTLNAGWGPLHFKILEKEPNKKIIYMYDFLSSYGERGTFYIELIEPTSGKVIVKTRNNIQEISKKARETLHIYNFFNQYLKYYLDSSIGKIVAKVVHKTFYEKSFDDLTIGNYRILQAKLNIMGKKFEGLKNKFFEVKAPLTLNSFNCSECGATLNITSKDEMFIICDHCSTPFLMEWQKG